jgi:hypothetical protein
MKTIGVQNRYTLLLFSLMALLLLSPFLSQLHFPAFSFLLLAIVVFLLKALKIRRDLFVLCGAVALAGIAIEGMVLLNKLPEYRFLFSVLIQVFYLFFVVFSTAVLVMRIFAEKSVSADTIGGGICAYLLTGLFWALLYRLIVMLDPDAFVILTPGKRIEDLFIYYSFGTLTTLGLGDISPMNELAMALSTLEAIWGQIFLTVFIARLVGLHLAFKPTPN